MADADSADFNGGNLTISFTAGGQAEDRLNIINEGNGAGQIAVVGIQVFFGSVPIGIFSGGTDGSTPLVITFSNASATPAAVQALLRNIAYSNVSENPSTGGRTIGFTANDGDGGTSVAASATVTITAVDDAPVAVADSGTTAENAVLNGTTVLTNDTDVDAGPKTVVNVNGTGGNVGTQITLASGALLTLNANGTYTYNPNGKFDYLVSAATATATGASNSSATDTFTYTLNGGSQATVTVTITGVDGTGSELRGGAGGDTLTGTGATDIFNLSQGGNDNVSGGGGDDGFYFGGAYTSADIVDGGAGSLDQLALRGDYSGGVTLGSISGVENIVLLSGSNTRFGGVATDRFNYNITATNTNVAAGQTLVISGNTLLATENFTFNGAAELDGSFYFYGGMGTETLTGGQQNDGFYFGINSWSSADRVDGQGGSLDQLGLQGNYSGASAVVFGASQIAGIENLILMTGADGRFGPGNAFNYDITMNDANVAVGTTFAVSANGLAATESLTLNAAAESDVGIMVFSGAGNDVLVLGQQADTVFGGAGNDRITGNLGADQLTGGAGNDSFVYTATAHSTAAAQDWIKDFATGDKIEVSAIDANTTNGTADSFVFIGSGSFTAAGQLRATNTGGNDWLVQGDVNGDGVADLSIRVTSDHALTIADFTGAVSQMAVEPVGAAMGALLVDLDGNSPAAAGAQASAGGVPAPIASARAIQFIDKDGAAVTLHMQNWGPTSGYEAHHIDPLSSHDFT